METSVNACCPAPERNLTPAVRFSVLLPAVWFGLAAGLLELALLIVRVKLIEHSGFLRSEHFYWMVPVADVVLYLACGLMLAIVARMWPTRAPVVVVGAFVFVTCLSQLLLVRGLNSLACMALAGGIARVTTPFLLARWPLIRQGMVRSLPVLLTVLMVLVGTGVSREAMARRHANEGRPAATAGSPNVLLIVLDTVRADHLSLYGYDRPTTPNLERFAKQGVRFDFARSTAPWTLPSHASMFTGRWPHELALERLGRLGVGFPTLAEFLRSRGYATAGVVANQFFCGHDSGLARGFDVYRDYPVTPGTIFRSSTLGWMLAGKAYRVYDELATRLTAGRGVRLALDFDRKDAAEVNHEFLNWLSQRGDRPFFAFLNYFDAHDPYIVPGDFHQHLGKVPHSRAESQILRDWSNFSQTSPGKDNLELARDAYDDCIASLDQQLGALFDSLTRQGLLEKTVVIVTADHGEQFGEHGHFRHGASLYEPEVHVPLVMVAPGRLPAGRVVSEPVTLRDLPATITDLIGPSEKSPFPGVSLARTWQASGDRSEDPLLSELGPLFEPTNERIEAPVGSEFESAALFEKSYVYIGHKGGVEELYDLHADPAESRDLSKSAESEPTLTHLRETLGRLLHSGSDAER